MKDGRIARLCFFVLVLILTCASSSSAQLLLMGVRDLGIKSKTPADSRGPLVVLQMKDSDAAVRKLASHNIVGSNRMDGLRLSFHIYNTADDVRSVLGVLRDNLDVAVRQ